MNVKMNVKMIVKIMIDRISHGVRKSNNSERIFTLILAYPEARAVITNKEIHRKVRGYKLAVRTCVFLCNAAIVSVCSFVILYGSFEDGEGLLLSSLACGCFAAIPNMIMLHDRSVNYFDEHQENGIRFANGLSGMYSRLTGNVIDFVEDSKTGEKKVVFKKISDISSGELAQTATTQEDFGVKDDGHKNSGGEAGDTEEQKWHQRDKDNKKAPGKKLNWKIIIGIGVVAASAATIFGIKSYINVFKPFSSRCKIGDIVTYGTYEQDGHTSNGAEEIEWIVLDVQGDQALLISKYGLNAIPYNEEVESITWENCTLRQWLNNDFLNAAFTAEEQDGIVLTTVVNDDNPKYGTEGGNNTEDYIFCLSLEEAGEYFDSDDARICNPTKYAIYHGVDTSISTHSCWWWLRSPGSGTRRAASVNYFGGLSNFGFGVNNADDAVRPALWVEISNLES